LVVKKSMQQIETLTGAEGHAVQNSQLRGRFLCIITRSRAIVCYPNRFGRVDY